jgi:hypothetical protein
MYGVSVVHCRLYIFPSLCSCLHIPIHHTHHTQLRLRRVPPPPLCNGRPEAGSDPRTRHGRRAGSVDCGGGWRPAGFELAPGAQSQLNTILHRRRNDAGSQCDLVCGGVRHAGHAKGHAGERGLTRKGVTPPPLSFQACTGRRMSREQL